VQKDHFFPASAIETSSGEAFAFPLNHRFGSVVTRNGRNYPLHLPETWRSGLSQLLRHE
jgi:hypothetical protein